MEYPINFGTLTQDIEFYEEVLRMHELASSYLERFDWCKSIKNSYVFLNLGSTLCIFIFEIENTASQEDNFLWVIVGGCSCNVSGYLWDKDYSRGLKKILYSVDGLDFQCGIR